MTLTQAPALPVERHLLSETETAVDFVCLSSVSLSCQSSRPLAAQHPVSRVGKCLQMSSNQFSQKCTWMRLHRQFYIFLQISLKKNNKKSLLYQKCQRSLLNAFLKSTDKSNSCTISVHQTVMYQTTLSSVYLPCSYLFRFLQIIRDTLRIL